MQDEGGRVEKAEFNKINAGIVKINVNIIKLQALKIDFEIIFISICNDIMN